jgi:hypothetical protein
MSDCQENARNEEAVKSIAGSTCNRTARSGLLAATENQISNSVFRTRSHTKAKGDTTPTMKIFAA